MLIHGCFVRWQLGVWDTRLRLPTSLDLSIRVLTAGIADTSIQKSVMAANPVLEVNNPHAVDF